MRRRKSYFTAQPGDADGDNRITVTDVTVILNVLRRSAPAAAVACGDLTDDGLITIKDLTALLMILSGQ